MIASLQWIQVDCYQLTESRSEQDELLFIYSSRANGMHYGQLGRRCGTRLS